MLDAVIDLSHHNGLALDFRAAAAGGILGVIHKATQGIVGVDPTWARHRQDALAAGLRFGAYHFGDGSDGAAQAAHFLAAVGPRPGELLALDLEDNPAGPSMTLEQARAFVGAVHGAVGRRPALYSGNALKRMLQGRPDPVLASCPLWLAQYGPIAVLPPGWASWTLWQYTDGSAGPPAPGIGHCDRDRFNGDAAALHDFWDTASR
ncbi:MAG TPA: glycoside hydrolase family 25 protein [Caulobacteraceae bacterium]|jgi:lysozyme|nr:glycoside hydrolase family 25 protein [Caulobacteraceae bacterium]